MTDPVVFERLGAVALLTLDRPEKLNALSFGLNGMLLRCIDDIERDDGLRAVILTGAGNQAFSAGTDISEFFQSIEAGVEVALEEFVQRGQAMTSRLENCTKPVIVAVGGIAFGGGCEIAEKPIWPLLATGRPLPSRRSRSAYRRHSAGPSDCRAWPGANVPCINC